MGRAVASDPEVLGWNPVINKILLLTVEKAEINTKKAGNFENSWKFKILQLNLFEKNGKAKSDKRVRWKDQNDKSVFFIQRYFD